MTQDIKICHKYDKAPSYKMPQKEILHKDCINLFNLLDTDKDKHLSSDEISIFNKKVAAAAGKDNVLSVDEASELAKELNINVNEILEGYSIINVDYKVKELYQTFNPVFLASKDAGKAKEIIASLNKYNTSLAVVLYDGLSKKENSVLGFNIKDTSLVKSIFETMSLDDATKEVNKIFENLVATSKDNDLNIDVLKSEYTKALQNKDIKKLSLLINELAYRQVSKDKLDFMLDWHQIAQQADLDGSLVKVLIINENKLSKQQEQELNQLYNKAFEASKDGKMEEYVNILNKMATYSKNTKNKNLILNLANAYKNSNTKNAEASRKEIGAITGYRHSARLEASNTNIKKAQNLAVKNSVSTEDLLGDGIVENTKSKALTKEGEIVLNAIKKAINDPRKKEIIQNLTAKDNHCNGVYFPGIDTSFQYTENGLIKDNWLEKASLGDGDTTVIVSAIIKICSDKNIKITANNIDSIINDFYGF